MEELRAANPLRAGDVTLVPIERAVIRSGKGDAGYWISAFKEPYAVVVSDASGFRALAADGSEMALDLLTDEIAGLAAILSEISAR